MASSGAIRKLKKEYGALSKDPVPGAVVRPLESNFLHAHFLLHGEVFYDTPYEGGIYHGVLKFPKNYPFAPPSVIMRTPSGRFELDKRICFSMSDFHAELWNPMWSTRTIVTGLISFMNSDDITTGGIDAPASRRTELARRSLQHCVENDATAVQIFSDFLNSLTEERRSLQLGAGASANAWPPVRPEPRPVPKPPSQSASTQPANTSKSSSNKERSTATKQPKDATAQEPSQSGPGKNAAKNKKKREKEKKKKLARKFVANLRTSVPPFVAAVMSDLKDNAGMDVSNHEADHVCWRTETREEYAELVDALRCVPDDCTLLIESEIGGRPIATFRLSEPISMPHHSVDVIEIPSPKPGRPYRAGLEHVEFVIGDNGNHGSPLNDDEHQRTFDEFMRLHPCLDWNTKGRNKAINPDISLELELQGDPPLGRCAVKFHLVALADVIEAEKANLLAS